MRIAIFQDFIENTGGSERLVLSLARELKATVITTNLNNSAVKSLGMEDVKIINLGNIPKIFALEHFLISLKFFLCDFSKEFDFFIFSGNRSIFAVRKHKPNLWYCHSPERAVFDLYNFYKKRMNFFQKLVFFPGAVCFKFATKRFAKKINKIVCNSENVKKRVKTFLQKDAVVVNPFVDVKKFYYSKPKDYWLSVNRLFPAKRIELQLEAFRKMPNQKLVIIGDFIKGDESEKYAKNLFENTPKNVKFKRNVSEKELAQLYSKSIGLIATSINEDFGFTPLEAMACGKPVVAVNEGGFKETILHEKTGLLIGSNEAEIIGAVKKISKEPEKYRKYCEKRAKEFSLERFVEKMKTEIKIEKAVE